MPTYTFRFLRIRPNDIYRPYIPVCFTNPATKKHVRAFSLIDTGADECALPASFAVVLGHHLEDGLEKKIGTGNGITTAYGHTTIITMKDFSTGEILIDFLPNLNVPLIGIRSFLGRFVLTVDFHPNHFR